MARQTETIARLLCSVDGQNESFTINFTMNNNHLPFRRSMAIICCTALLGLIFGANLALATDAVTSAEVDRTEMVDIGGRKLQMHLWGNGSPTVIIETGMGEPGAEGGSWRAVVDEISKKNRVCTYDRAGLGKSEPAPNLPRTSQDVAKDLSALLAKAGVPGPYLLVGHSFGGIHIRVFASQYPDKVLGLVLVDSSQPNQDEKWLAVLSTPVANEVDSVTKARQFLIGRKDPSTNPEHIDPKASGAQAQAAQNLGSKPVVILSHSSKFRLDPSLPEDVSLKLEKVCSELQADLKRLSSNSTLTQSINGGHLLQNEDPDLVIKGIRQALELVKKQTK